MQQELQVRPYIEVSICSEKGVRANQDDSYGSIRLGTWEFFAVADGYGLRHSEEKYLSSTVVWLAFREAARKLEANPDITVQTYKQFFKDIFQYIDSHTRKYTAGSTLAIACHKRESNTFYTAALGDSLLVHLRQKNIQINPREHLHLGKEKLWGSFGDELFAEHHVKEPECQIFEIKEKEALLISSDGLFSNHEPKQIEIEARDYANLVFNLEMKAHDLVHLAHYEKKTNDNATAILIQRC